MTLLLNGMSSNHGLKMDTIWKLEKLRFLTIHWKLRYLLQSLRYLFEKIYRAIPLDYCKNNSACKRIFKVWDDFLPDHMVGINAKFRKLNQLYSKVIK